MPSFALSAIGRDRPGIVAAVAEVLFEQGCNVEDSSMTLLRGNFAIMLVLASPQGATAASLTDALRPACEKMGLVFSVQDVEDTAHEAFATHVLTVYGADRPGILAKITELLAERHVNITDLNSRLVGAEQPVYALLLELAIPEGAADDIERGLSEVTDEIGVDFTLRIREDDIL
ncbi:MAG TPA: ACT domain-containing protein [Actinomycetota bacterium]|jgi:glycine cleavage system transcriptional repressor|nr:ACT domain-containing protein [Actinomycetota bacterium]